MFLKKLERLWKEFFIELLDRIETRRSFSSERPSEERKEEIRRILIVKQHDQLGDFLLASPVIRAVKRSFPRAHLSLCVRSYTEPVARNHPDLDEVIVFYERLSQWSPTRMGRFWRGLRSRPFDLSIVLNTFSHSLTSDLIAIASRAKIRLGPSTPLLNGRNPFYTLKPVLVGTHESDRYLSILAPLGIQVHPEEEELRAENVYLTHEEREGAKRFFYGRRTPFIVLHPGAGKLPNRWPHENFACLGDRLKKRYGGEVFILWGRQDGKVGKEVMSRMEEGAIPIKDLSLRSLLAILSYIHLFIGNDTGLIHLAGAVRIPSIGIYGPTDPERWKPIGKWVWALRGGDGSCDSISVEEVERIVEEMMDEDLIDSSQFHR